MSINQNSIITKDDESIAGVMHEMRKSLKRIDEVSHNYHPLLGGERYLTDKELSHKLKISRRTLQGYRTNRTIPFIFFGGKTLYKESEIDKILSENYRKSLIF